MSLRPGDRVGPYEVTALIGAGGMGEVYKARDSRLGRVVAIKIVRTSSEQSSDGIRRFEREARATGMLNHPNILAVYDVGAHEGLPYLVSEFLEGETFAARLSRGIVPTKKTLEYAAQLATGLAAAHAKGFVHRDLKPSNLFITTDGQIKILDFGLVKLTEQTEFIHFLSRASTASQLTQAGAIVGTMNYLSPEQIRGDTIDHRSDIFSFGTVLFEALTGQRPFERASPIETMNAILNQDPADLPDTVPPNVGLVVRRCLEKVPQERFESARDLAFHLSTLSHGSGSGPTTPPLVAGRGATRRRFLRLAAAVSVFVGVAAAFVVGQRTNPATTAGYQQLTFQRGWVRSARFAPDGGTIVYGAAWDESPVRLFSTRPESPESRRLEIPSADILAISSSNEMAISLGERYVGTLARVPLEGGGPREIMVDVEDADWAPDGERLAVAQVVQQRYRLEFPIGRVLYETDGWISHVRVSRDGNRVAFIDHPVSGDDLGAVCVIGRNGEKETLSADFASVTGLAWSSTGDEIWFSASEAGPNTSLYAVDLSRRQRLVTTAPGRLDIKDIGPDGRVLVTHGRFRIGMRSRGPGGEQERDLSWLGTSVAAGLSADGQTLLFTEEAGGGGTGSYPVYVRQTDGSAAIRLGEGLLAALSWDGRWAATIGLGPPPSIVVLSTRAGEARLLERGGLVDYQAVGWFPDGRRLLIAGTEPGRDVRLYAQDIGNGMPKAISPEGIRIKPYASPVSPDGKQVAAVDRSSRIVLQPVGGGEPTPLPELEPGDEPIRWSADGSSLYVLRRGVSSGRVYRLQIAQRQVELTTELLPSDRAGLIGILAVQTTPHGEFYVYSYTQDLSDLFLVDNLR